MKMDTEFIETLIKPLIGVIKQKCQATVGREFLVVDTEAHIFFEGVFMANVKNYKVLCINTDGVQSTYTVQASSKASDKSKVYDRSSRL